MKVFGIESARHYLVEEALEQDRVMEAILVLDLLKVQEL